MEKNRSSFPSTDKTDFSAEYGQSASGGHDKS
jgi:hypothetical protein